MEKQTKKGWFAGFIAVIFLTNVCNMNDQAIIPVINNIYGQFPDQTGTVNFIVSGSLIIYIIVSMLCGKLMERIGKKYLLVVSWAVFTVAAIFCGAVDSALYMAVMRGIIAASLGIVNVAGLAMLTDAFRDENKRSTFIGLYNSAMALIGAVMAFVAGLLAVSAWQNVFKVFYICMPIFVLMLIFLPNTPPEKEAVAEENAAKEKIDMKQYIPFLLSVLVFCTMFMIYQYMMSVYIAEHAIGDEAFSGLCASLLTIASAVVCACFGLIYPKLKKATFIPSFVVIALCYLAMMLFPSKATALIASTLIGASYGNGFSYFYMEATVIVPESRISNSIAIVTAVQGIGMFISTYVATLAMSLMKTESITATYPVYIAFLTLGAVYTVTAAIKQRRSA